MVQYRRPQVKHSTKGSTVSSPPPDRKSAGSVLCDVCHGGATVLESQQRDRSLGRGLPGLKLLATPYQAKPISGKDGQWEVPVARVAESPTMPPPVSGVRIRTMSRENVPSGGLAQVEECKCCVPPGTPKNRVVVASGPFNTSFFLVLITDSRLTRLVAP